MDRPSHAQSPALADQFTADVLRSWYDRLGRFDPQLPEPERFGIERLIAYEENAGFTYAFGLRSAPHDDSISLRFRRVLSIKPRRENNGTGNAT